MMSRTNIPGLLIAIAMIAVLSVPAYAGVVLDQIGSAVSHRADSPAIGSSWTIGSLFQVGTNALSVTALGVQDSSPTGPATDGFFASPVSVGLWSWNGTTATLLASTAVASSDTLGADNYRYKTLTTPVTLSAGAQYLIGARVGGGIEWFEDNGFGVAAFASGDPNITLLANHYGTATNPTLAAPVSDGGATLGRWGAANAQFDAIIPTPAALPAGLGLLTLLALRRRGA